MLDRRGFLEAGAALATLAAAPCFASADPAFVASPGAWRAYEIRTAQIKLAIATVGDA